MSQESDVLREAVGAFDDWLHRLPPDSRWRRTLSIAREGMSKSIAHDELSEREREPHYRADVRPAGWHERARASDRQRRAPWEQLTVFERDRLTLEAIGENGPSTVAEATAKLNAHFGDDIVYESHVRSIVRRLYAAGELERIRVPPGEIKGKRNGTRWRYTRKVALSGPIADLERAFHDADEGKAPR